ncbi:uncharacterized protein [Narcine bancroftii]|uniref:uncharacterized protein n=1 Tax=Narcine bancroftii TaxID=1343680 RepID=UPI0038313610
MESEDDQHTRASEDRDGEGLLYWNRSGIWGRPQKYDREGSFNFWSQMGVTNQLSRAEEETAPGMSIITEEQNAVNDSNQDAEDTTSCNDVSVSSQDSCSEANSRSKAMNESSHEPSHKSPMPEQNNVQEIQRAEDKDIMKNSQHSKGVEDTSQYLDDVAEEQNDKIVESSKNTEDSTNCPDNATFSTESNSNVNTGSEVMNKSLQEHPQRATTLELNDVQRMLHEDKILHHQKVSKRTNTNQSSFDKTTDLEQNKNNDEKQTLEAELQKCIEDLKKLKIPSSFLKKQRQWQNELLKKYDM